MQETCDTHLTVPCQVDPATWRNLKNILSESPAPTTCLDCVEPTYPPSEITSQCTDKCVVVACNDPGHEEISCRGGQRDPHCDLVCDGGRGCTDCTGFDEFLQCCTDYHSYFSEPRITEPQALPASWDSSFDNLLCGCDEQGLGAAGRTYVPLDTFTSAESGIGHMPATNNISRGPPYSSFVPAQALELACMWGNCQARFACMSDLVGHVNLEHLRLPPSPPASPTTRAEFQSDGSALSCLWRDCTVYATPESIPTSSSGDPIDNLLNVLAHHLLHDHLGHNLPAPALEDDPPTCLAPQTDSNQQNWKETSLVLGADRSISPLPHPSHQCSGSHKCNWKSCGQSFATCSDLTSHITAVHVGGGKAHYECFWEGCNRNGSNGFSSKQKIARHLQSHTGHRPYQCEVCLQNFSEAATLQQHMRRHTQEKPYKCDYPGCGKSFAITGALTIHKRTHNGHKPFKCKFCDRAFAESSNLSKHLRTHTGARPYACTESGCNKSFARPDQLSRHMGVHRKRNHVNECTE